MSLDATDLEKIAWLARLNINPDDTPGYCRDLTRILALVEKMNSVDTTNVEPMSHPLSLTARLRPDEITEENQRDSFQAIAPLVEDGLYLVPRVIE